jgi:hypothetical protein
MTRAFVTLALVIGTVLTMTADATTPAVARRRQFISGTRLSGTSTTSAASSYTGIPAPPFGVNETVANLFGDTDYYTHWVDSTAGNCSDAGNGTPSVPRCNLPTISSAAAGTVVQVRGGPYTLSANYTVGGTGTAANPVVLRGPTYAGRITINTNGTRSLVQSGSYSIVENVKLTNGDQDMVLLSGDHVVFRDSEVVGTNTTVDLAGCGICPASSSYAVVFRNLVHDLGDWTQPTDINSDLHCLGVSSNHTFTWYLANEVYHCGGDGLGNGHDANHTTHDFYVGGNNIHDNRENAIDLKEVHNFIISENTLHDQLDVDSAEGALVVIHYGPTTGDGPYNAWIINNLLYNAVYGIVSTNVQDVGTYPGSWWIGNVVYNMSAIGLNPDRGGGTLRLYHNTVEGSAGGIQSGGNSATNVILEHGNIVSNLSGIGAGGFHFEVFNSTVRANSEVSHELYYQNGSDLGISWGATYTSVASWIAGTVVGDNSLQADPLFTNAASRDYTLQAGSPAINAGYDMSTVAATFTAAFGTSLLFDRAHTPRPNGVWDMGAYERASPPAPELLAWLARIWRALTMAPDGRALRDLRPAPLAPGPFPRRLSLPAGWSAPGSRRDTYAEAADCDSTPRTRHARSADIGARATNHEVHDHLARLGPGHPGATSGVADDDRDRDPGRSLHGRWRGSLVRLLHVRREPADSGRDPFRRERRPGVDGRQSARSHVDGVQAPDVPGDALAGGDDPAREAARARRRGRAVPRGASGRRLARRSARRVSPLLTTPASGGAT